MKELYMVCYILLIFSFPTHEFIKNDSFIVMTNLLQRENFAVDHWEVIIKEQLTKAQTNELLQQKLPIVNLKQEDEQAKTYHFNINFKTDLTVQVKLIVPKDHHAKSELMTVIKHNHLNTSVIESYKHVKTFLNERFYKENAHLFACIKLDSGAIINENDFFKKLQQIFHIKHPIAQKDSTHQRKHYEIVYGNSYLFEESLRVNDHSMNVHLVKRIADNQEPAFFIGTPILLNEY